MSNHQHKRLMAQRHNARLDAPKVEPLFAWLAALCQWQDPREVEKGVGVGALQQGRSTRRAMQMALVAAATVHAPIIPDRLEPSVRQRGRRR